jgi:hypothetical protein
MASHKRTDHRGPKIHLCLLWSKVACSQETGGDAPLLSIPKRSRAPVPDDTLEVSSSPDEREQRLRDKVHLKFVSSQPCLICGRQPSDPHHLRFAQPRALGLKVSDEFTVPLCRGHHRQLHQAGNEVAWWETLNINALETAKHLWEQTHPSSVSS